MTMIEPSALRRLAERQERQLAFMKGLNDSYKVYQAAFRKLLRQCKRLANQLEKKEIALADAEDRVGDLSLEYQRARDRETSILRGLLPEDIAALVADNPRQLIADEFSQVTVLSASMVDFERVTQGFGAVKLVESLNQLFSVFDVMAKERGVERVRTMGDSYMCVSGAPSRRGDHASVAADLAMEMMGIVSRLKLEEKSPLSMRIGLHSGPIIAGVIGERRPTWDLFGHSVKTALAVQECGMPDTIQVSDECMGLAERDFEFEPAEIPHQAVAGTQGLWILTGRKRKP
jgi:class 3 adenylate cyclase